MQNYSDSNLPLADSGRPYVDLEINNKYVIREFSQNIDPIELMWHRDNEDRTVEVLEAGNGWKFQYDEQLPLEFKQGVRIFIHKHDWHRVIKGKGNLILKIEKDGSIYC